MWCDPDDFTDFEDFLRLYLRAGDYVVDVGANIGTTALTACASVGQAGRVLAVEAHPVTFRYLRGNMHLNQTRNIEAVNVAAGERTDVVGFGNSHRRDDQNAVDEAGGVQVPMRLVDDLVPPWWTIALMKIDVEGYELPVLQGARQTLRRTACVVFEAGEEQCARFGYAIADLVATLEASGWMVCRVSERREVVPAGDGNLAGSWIGDNLIAVKDVAAFRTRLGLEQERVT